MKTMGDLFNLEPETAPTGPVECLGMTFPNDEEMRERFEEYLDGLTKGKEPGKVGSCWSDGNAVGET